MTTRAESLGQSLENMMLNKVEDYQKRRTALNALLDRLIELLNEDPLWKNHVPTLMKACQLLMIANSTDFKAIWDVALGVKAGKIPHYGEEKNEELEAAKKLVHALTPQGRQRLIEMLDQNKAHAVVQ